jgi:hypothetical protein
MAFSLSGYNKLILIHSWPRRRRVSYPPVVIHSSSIIGVKKSDQVGFLPILSLFFCLLIYARQQRPKYATLIFLAAGKTLVGRSRPLRCEKKDGLMLVEKTGTGP